jgi:hypothetical protein
MLSIGIVVDLRVAVNNIKPFSIYIEIPLFLHCFRQTKYFVLLSKKSNVLISRSSSTLPDIVRFQTNFVFLDGVS